MTRLLAFAAAAALSVSAAEACTSLDSVKADGTTVVASADSHRHMTKATQPLVSTPADPAAQPAPASDEAPEKKAE